MKILIYCWWIVGSRSFGNWLSLETGLHYYFEPLKFGSDRSEDLMLFGKFLENELKNAKHTNFKTDENFITKIFPNEIDYKKLVNYFDKIIVLYRENTLEQAESIIWSKYNKMSWPNFYEIDDKYLKDNQKEILNTKNDFDKRNLELKKLENCLHITYEEFFYSDTGIKKVEEYLGIKTKTLPNSSNKLRNGTLSTQDRIKNELNNYQQQLKTEIISEIYSKLKNELNNYKQQLKTEIISEIHSKLKNELIEFENVPLVQKNELIKNQIKLI
jgi:hypothetical protein